MKAWLQTLFHTAMAHGATGVIVFVLVVALACVVSGTSATVIYAIAVLITACTLLTIAVTTALRGHHSADADEEKRPAQRFERDRSE
ncbi:hypothetical protein [Amycolatopsis sp. NPDC051371]|uniref:hypothetical protein n=1 Tax=Amycolatopsis sp. NPDC051371 TaxID=3155800 RepID=UPI0034415254